jgi:hypothetical protein
MPVIEALETQRGYNELHKSVVPPFPSLFLSQSTWVISATKIPSPVQRRSYYQKVRHAQEQNPLQLGGSSTCGRGIRMIRRPGAALLNIAHMAEHDALDVAISEVTPPGVILGECRGLTRYSGEGPGEVEVILVSYHPNQGQYLRAAMLRAVEAANEHFARPPRVRARRRP